MKFYTKNNGAMTANITKSDSQRLRKIENFEQKLAGLFEFFLENPEVEFTKEDGSYSIPDEQRHTKILASLKKIEFFLLQTGYFNYICNYEEHRSIKALQDIVNQESGEWTFEQAEMAKFVSRKSQFFKKLAKDFYGDDVAVSDLVYIDHTAE